MKVILAEKPSVAKTIASFLKANTRREIGRASCRERVSSPV